MKRKKVSFNKLGHLVNKIRFPRGNHSLQSGNINDGILTSMNLRLHILNLIKQSSTSLFSAKKASHWKTASGVWIILK